MGKSPSSIQTEQSLRDVDSIRDIEFEARAMLVPPAVDQIGSGPSYQS